MELWRQCVDLFRDELPSQQLNTWIHPLQAEAEGDELRVYTPNRFVLNWANEKYFDRLLELLGERGESQLPAFSLLVGSEHSRTPCATIIPSQTHTTSPPPAAPPPAPVQPVSAAPVVVLREGLLPATTAPSMSSDSYEPEGPSIDPLIATMPVRVAPTVRTKCNVQVKGTLRRASYLNRTSTFKSFIEGKSNQLARVAAWQMADSLKHGYNPLFLYGNVGLGRAHLIHAMDNHLLKKNPSTKVVYLHSERSVTDMVKALRLGATNELRRFYRSVGILLTDDIQFFARRERSQEEFFHTFNALPEGGQQVILANNRYPREIEGLEERLRSRFDQGLTMAVEPPKLEARVAIPMKKAKQAKIELPYDAAFFIVQRIHSNVRKLEGALRRVTAYSHFTDRPTTIELIRESLKDLLALQDKLVNIDNIQHTVAEYYKIKISDLLSKRRSCSATHPRQAAMTLSKELTNHNLPEIGVVFGGRDRTTVLYACRKIAQLREPDADIREDYESLLHTLTT